MRRIFIYEANRYSLLLRRRLSSFSRKNIQIVEVSSSQETKVYNIPSSASSESNKWDMKYISNNLNDSNNNKDQVDFKKMFDKSIKHLLPSNYEETVAPGYVKYASFQFLANVSSSAAMVLSTQALLQALGFSSGVSVGASATLNWVLKDGIGQFGGILFASYMGKRKEFDTAPKKWWIISGLAMDLATVVEILTPLFPSSFFLPLASVANVGKNVSFLSASASRAAINQSFATKGNLADVTVKAGTQGIAASLTGTGFGCLLSATVVGNEFSYIFPSFVVLSVLHQIGNYVAMKNVPLNTIDEHRFHILVSNFIQHECILSPISVSAKDDSFLSLKPPAPWLKVGVPFETMFPDLVTFQKVSGILSKSKYFLRVVLMDNGNSKVMLTFHADASVEDILTGLLHAYYAQSLIYPYGNFGDNKLDHLDDPIAYEELEYSILSSSKDMLKVQNETFLHKLKSEGWSFEHHNINLEDNKAHRLRIESSKHME